MWQKGWLVGCCVSQCFFLPNYLIGNSRPVLPSSATPPPRLSKPHAPRRALPTDSIQQREKEAGQLTMQAVRIAIFFVNYFIENRRAVLPSSATALLYKEQTPRPTLCPPAASIQNPPKEAGQFTVQVVSFVFFYLVNYSI
jgi:hypothetical protein